MNLLLESAIKISVVVALGLFAASLFSRRSAALRHWLLAASMAAALATPVLMQVAPMWRLPVAAQMERTREAATPRETTRREPRIGITMSVDADSTSPASPSLLIDASSILLISWMAGVAVHLAGLLVGFWRLRQITVSATIIDDGPWFDTARRLAEQFGLRAPVTLLQSDRPALLVTWGVFSPKVLLPVDAASWDHDRIRVVLAHELSHVQRQDWIIQIGSELLRIANWFNPLVWLAAARLRLESERACDDAVVSLGIGGREYAQHLVDLARQFGRARHASFPAVAIAPRRSNLEQRVRAMLNNRLSRRPMTPFARVTTMAALLAVTLPIVLFAQNTFATLAGALSDQSGGVLPGVVITATDRERDVRHIVRTDGAGRFEIVGLPQGRYSLQASLPGFETFEQELTIGAEDIQRNITLSIGTLQETVSVTGPGGPRNTFPPAPSERAKARSANCGQEGPRASAPPPRAGAIRVGGQIRTPAKLYHVRPLFPEGSPAGVVIMKVVIGPDGLVKETDVTNNPPVALVQSAVEAVRQWEFEPTLLNCVAVPVRMTVTVDYR